MPRGQCGSAYRRRSTQALRLESLRREIHKTRRAERERQGALARRDQVPGWTDLVRRIEVLDIQEEIDAMELRLLNDARAELGLPLFETYPRDGAVHPPAPADLRKPRDDYRNY